MRSLILRLPLLLAPFAAPLLFASPAKAAFLPSCCGIIGEGEPPHADPETAPPTVGARVRRPAERALEASAEAPATADASLADAIGTPLSELPELPKPARERVPTIAGEDDAPLFGIDDHGADLISLPGCCQTEGETHLPDREPEEKSPPELVTAEVKRRESERLLTMAVEAQIEVATKLINAIGIPLYPVDEDRRGVSEPARVPAFAGKAPTFDDMPDCCTTARDRDRQPPVTVDAPWRWLDALRANAEILVLALLVVVAIGFALRARRRRIALEDDPAPRPRPLPDELPWPDAAPVPMFEPEVVQAKARQAEREGQSA